MGRIKALDQSTILKLAAGEIIDRPVSIVKELVENSIDAGASIINVNLKDGGISEIMIDDNGQGIDPEDIKLTILPHATSKLKEFKDLEDVITMGFRGEALASIAEVADLQILTKTPDEEIGTILKKSAITKDLSIKQMARNNGTTVTISHLFKNVPVRFKFLKNAATECGYITKCIQTFSLHYPMIRFCLTNNDNEIFSTNGNDDLQSLFSNITKSSIDQIISFYKTTGEITVSGVITSPNKTYKNRQKCWFSVNQRVVNSPIFIKAMQVALTDIIPKQHYPGIVCNIDMPTEDVDINIHPKKEDVKFTNSDEVFLAIKRAIKSAIQQQSSVWESSLNHINANEVDMKITEKKQMTQSTNNVDEFKVNNLRGKINSEIEVVPTLSENTFNRYIKNEPVKIEMPNNPQKNEGFSTQFQKTSSNSSLINISQTIKWVSFKEKYIIVPTNSHLLIFDQHAVHERILYDKYKTECLKQQFVIMPLLVPEYVQIDEPWYEKVASLLPIIQSIGIDIEVFDSKNFIIREIPQLFSKLNIGDWINSWINDGLIEDIYEAPNEIIKEKIQMKSCKAAVKAGQKLSDTEVTALIERCLLSENQYTCPHGRPLYIKLSENKLDSLFLRN